MKLYENKKIKEDKAITLVTLVLTIIILLILAGISIATLTGKNGILTKAQQAKETNIRSTAKEQLELAIAGWQIERNLKNDISLKDYLENASKSGLENVQIKQEGSEDENTIGLYDNKMFIYNNQGITVMNSDNLVKNGFLEEKNNSNFPSFTYNEDGYLSCLTNGSKKVYISDYIPIDSNKKYFQSITTKTNNLNSEYYIGFVEFDIDKKDIDSDNVMYTDKSLTYLDKDLKNGDTEVYLNDVTGFKKDNTISYYQKGFIFWNYKDSTGYQYPELTYSRNCFPDNGLEALFEINDIHLDKNSITLSKPWNYGAFTKGTKLSQRSAGRTFNYGLVEGNNLTINWKTYTNYIESINEKSGVTNDKFRQGTKYIKIVMIINYNQTIESTTDIKDIIFAECE